MELFAEKPNCLLQSLRCPIFTGENKISPNPPQKIDIYCFETVSKRLRSINSFDVRLEDRFRNSNCKIVKF
jgi:hypothetical protein